MNSMTKPLVIKLSVKSEKTNIEVNITSQDSDLMEILSALADSVKKS